MLCCLCIRFNTLQDEGLRRGKPLFLSHERFAALQRLVSSQCAGKDHMYFCMSNQACAHREVILCLISCRWCVLVLAGVTCIKIMCVLPLLCLVLQVASHDLDYDSVILARSSRMHFLT